MIGTTSFEPVTFTYWRSRLYENFAFNSFAHVKALAKPTTSQTCDGHCQSRTQSPPHFDSLFETTPFSSPNLITRPNSNIAELKDYIAEAFKNVHATLQLAHGSEQRASGQQ